MITMGNLLLPQGPYTPIIPEKVLSLIPRFFFLYLRAFEFNKTSDRLNHTV